jgi:hypothetical protein
MNISGSAIARIFLAAVSLLSCLVFSEDSLHGSIANGPSEKTLFLDCAPGEKPKRVLSAVSVSEEAHWRAYVEVDLQPGCLHTSRLWVARQNGPFHLLYLMPPKREADGNGMQILGWARHSRMLLVKTEEWQYGSDAADVQQVLAIDGGTGMVYDPRLDAMLDDRKQEQCSFRVTDAGFSAGQNVEILVRAKFSTAIEEGETLDDVPPSKRCSADEETWSFNFATGEIHKITNVGSLQIYNKRVPNPIR